MNLLFKTIIKNTFGKPLRSLLVIFAIFVCSLAAMFCFDFGGAEKDLINYVYSSVIGDADIVMYGTTADIDRIPDDLPDNEMLMINVFSDNAYEDIDGEYYVATTESISINGVDPAMAEHFGLIDHMEIPDGQIVITEPLADLYGCETGGTITVHDNSGEEVDLIVADIVPARPVSLLLNGLSGIVNPDTSDILSCGKRASGFVSINVLDDSKVEETMEILKNLFPGNSIENYTIDSTTQNVLNEILGFMFILFAVAFLLVIFITSSISQRIVGERMSFIGTLRSFGMSTSGTCIVLMLENIIYAILGSVPGVWLYCAVRGPMMQSMFSATDSNGNAVSLPVPELPSALVVCVVLGAVLVEILIPLRSQLKALHTSIRDIIFDNRDTEYKFSRFGTVFGIIMAVAAVVIFFMRRNLFAAGACLITAVTAAAFLYPYVLKAVTSFIANHARKAGKEKWALAAVEAGTRKSSVGSGTLCVTSATMCIIILTVATSLISMFQASVYDCDVIATCHSLPKYNSYVEYLDGVTGIEYVYDKVDWITVNGNNEMGQVYGLPEGGYRHYHGLLELPDTMEDGTILIEVYWASQNGYNIGDEITLVFDPYGVFPVEKTFTIAAFFKMEKIESMKNNFVITLRDYIDIYHDSPATMLVMTDDPEGTAAAIGKYSVGKVTDVKTLEDYLLDNRQSNASVIKIFTAVIIVAVVMTFIGMASNQLIGFQGRRKECAVMVSTSMSKGTLSGVLFREMLITSAVSCTTGALLGALLVTVVKTAVMSSQAIYLELTVNPLFIAFMWAVMTLVFALTVLMPVRNLYKMKLSEQLKYE